MNRFVPYFVLDGLEGHQIEKMFSMLNFHVPERMQSSC